MIAQGQRSLILGTAGHIDHGKSTLIKALTGVDPDRLAEEKRRGITIELGFAQLSLPDGTYMGVVDVPGHERFVRQMIAGASGIDMALLCIAADDGIMPQTREHLAVLELLGVQTCVVALTKCDLVDEEWIALVCEEIRDELQATPYAAAEIVTVSARSGYGLDKLREVLTDTASLLRTREKSGPVRLPIDRVFTIKGAGTVITGTLWQGEVHPESELELLPKHKLVRVRGVQVHDREVAVSMAGNRTALNLANIKAEEIRPGDFLVTPGTLEVSNRFDARFVYLPTNIAVKPLETGARIHVAHGTREVTGRILFMNGQEQMSIHDTAYVQVRLDSSLPLSRGDYFIVRSYSPMSVIGGGTVLNNHPRRRTTLTESDRALLDALAREDEQAMCMAAIDSFETPISSASLSRITGLSISRVSEVLDAALADASKTYVVLGKGRNIYYARLSVVQKHVMTIENTLLNFHTQNPTATGISKGALRALYPHYIDDDCFEVLLEEAVLRGRVVLVKGEVRHPKAGLSARNLEEQTARTLLAILQSYGTKPPDLACLLTEVGVDERRGLKALGTLEQSGQVCRVGKTYWFTAEAVDELWNRVQECLAQHGKSTVADLKDAMGISRKYAIPVLEYFDACHKTIRQGDVRVLAR